MKHHPEWSPEKMVKMSISKYKRHAKRNDEEQLDRIDIYKTHYLRMEGNIHFPIEMYQNKKIKRYIGMIDKENLSYHAIYDFIKKYLVDPIARSASQPML